ncbi:SDR family oxidoreductase [Pedococcus sp. 2YAF34]|uniref:SDR family oxidoreductase n=1 Tax=Pedococcus sp. 2YAF34 TaxID=3233032 RepID=UPI003F978D72
MSRVVAVTGASGGVGRACVQEFARRGDRLALLARGTTGLDAAADEARRAGAAEVITVPVDVADAGAVEEAVARIEQDLGPVDVWVNSAFTSVFAPFHEITAQEYQRATEVTYLGYVHCTMSVLRRMRERDRGVIVQVGSALAYRGVPLQTVYCGARHAVQGFHESLRCELLHDRSGVSVTMVQMPALNTPQFTWVLSKLPQKAQPVPPIYQPEVAARAVAFAADHPRRREYWVGASTVGTLVANAVAPGLLDRYLARTGYSSQQTGEPRDPDQPVNMWEPADGPEGRDFGAHGTFDARAKTRSWQQVVAHHYPQVAAAAVGATAVATVASIASRLGRRAGRGRA